MLDREVLAEIARRRTFAIISHPDAGKTTLTEKFLLFGGAVRLAGTVKGRKAARHATSDWMELEKQRGISVTSSVMQFPYAGRIVNLLDTPGHEDFSEDTYRTLTAVDSALMVIDGARGIESRTIRLMEVCRLRDTPIVTFVNKLDRASREPVELLDEIEGVLGLQCAPVTWPIGSGGQFKGVYHLLDDRVHFFSPRHDGRIVEGEVVEGIDNPALERAARDAGRGAARGGRARARREPRARPRRLPVRPHDPGVLRVRSQQLRGPRAAGGVRRAGAAARSARGPSSARSLRWRIGSAGSCSRSRRTWTRSTATASRSCA